MAAQSSDICMRFKEEQLCFQFNLHFRDIELKTQMFCSIAP